MAKECKRFVVVEDAVDVRDSIVDFLQSLGHTVSAAGDGITGLALILHDAPHIALIDLGLPGIDGLAVARGVRQASVTATTLVALTGASGAEQRHQAMAAGFDKYISKPTSLDRLEKIAAGDPA